MIGMALFQGLLDREGRVLDKANRLAKSGLAALEVNAHGRATIAFVKALEILEAQEPRARIEDFQEAYATIGSGLLRVGRIESAQVAATHALTGNGGDLRALGLQGDIWLAQERASDALGYYDAGLRIDPKAKDFWERKGDAHVALEQRPEAIRAYIQVVNLDPDDVEGYRRVLSLVPDDAELWVRTGEAHRRRNELDEAQTAFDRALRINSDTKEALEGKALTYLAAGEPQRAIRCLDRVDQPRRATAQDGPEHRCGERIRPRDQPDAEDARAARRSARGAPVSRSMGRGRQGGLESHLPRPPPCGRPVCEGPRMHPVEPPRGSGRGPRRFPRGRAAVLRRARGETGSPSADRTMVRSRRRMRRHPSDPAAPSAGLERQRTRPARPRQGRGGVRDVRDAPSRRARRPGRAAGPARRAPTFEERQGPPPDVRGDPPERSRRCQHLDRARGGPPDPGSIGGIDHRVRHRPPARSPKHGRFRAQGGLAVLARTLRRFGESVRRRHRGEPGLRGPVV